MTRPRPAEAEASAQVDPDVAAELAAKSRLVSWCRVGAVKKKKKKGLNRLAKSTACAENKTPHYDHYQSQGKGIA